MANPRPPKVSVPFDIRKHYGTMPLPARQLVAAMCNPRCSWATLYQHPTLALRVCATFGYSKRLAKTLRNGGKFNEIAVFLALKRAVQKRYVDCVRQLLPMNTLMYGTMLIDAAHAGFTECVRMIQPYPISEKARGDALIAAAFAGRVTCVQLLMNDDRLTQEMRDTALGKATHDDHVECVQALMPSTQLNAHIAAFSLAAEAQNTGCVRCLAPVVTPRVRASTFRTAMMHHNIFTVSALMPFMTVD